MKLTKITIVLVLLTCSFASCDKVDELTEFDTSFSLSQAVNVNISEEDPTSFSQSILFDLADDGDVADNIDRLERIEVTSLTYSFSNISGNEEAQITNAKLLFGGVPIDIDPVFPSLVAGQNFEVENAAALNEIENILRNNPQVTAVLQGSVDDVPLAFTGTIKLEVTVTIDAL